MSISLLWIPDRKELEEATLQDQRRGWKCSLDIRKTFCSCKRQVFSSCTHMAADNRVKLQSQRFSHPVLASVGTSCTCSVQRYTCRQNTHAHRIKSIKYIFLQILLNLCLGQTIKISLTSLTCYDLYVNVSMLQNQKNHCLHKELLFYSRNLMAWHSGLFRLPPFPSLFRLANWVRLWDWTSGNSEETQPPPKLDLTPNTLPVSCVFTLLSTPTSRVKLALPRHFSWNGGLFLCFSNLLLTPAPMWQLPTGSYSKTRGPKTILCPPGTPHTQGAGIPAGKTPITQRRLGEQWIKISVNEMIEKRQRMTNSNWKGEILYI